MGLCSPVIPQWLTETNYFKLTVCLSMLWHGWGIYRTWSEPSQPNEISQQQEGSSSLQLINMSYRLPFVPTILVLSINSSHIITPTECVNYWFSVKLYDREVLSLWEKVVKAGNKTLRVTHIADWGLILLSSWHNWLAAGPWPRWLLPSTSQGLSCPGCWSADPWRSSAHLDWQQCSHTLR